MRHQSMFLCSPLQQKQFLDLCCRLFFLKNRHCVTVSCSRTRISCPLFVQCFRMTYMPHAAPPPSLLSFKVPYGQRLKKAPFQCIPNVILLQKKENYSSLSKQLTGDTDFQNVFCNIISKIQAVQKHSGNNLVLFYL